MPRRIWIVSELYYPEQTSTGFFITKIAEGLAQYFSVHALCGQPNYSARGVRAPKREKHKGVYIQRCLGTTFRKDDFLLRLINMVSLSLSIFILAIFKVRKQDHVIVVTTPPSLPFLLAAVCRLRRAKCLLLIHDVYPEVLIACGIYKSNTILMRLLGWLSQRLYHSVDRIIVLGRDIKSVVLRRYKSNDHNVKIIPNWADLYFITPGERVQNVLINKLGIGEKFIVQFSGNMGRTHGIECLVESAKKLIDQKDIHFLFIGGGAKRRWLQCAVQKNGLHNVTLLQHQARSELSIALNACDLAIIPFVPGMAGLSVPSRMYNILAAGKPIIAAADRNSELAAVIQEEKLGWVVLPDQPDKVVEAILNAKANPDLLLEMGKRARLAAKTKYSFHKVIESYYDVIHNMES